MYIMYNYYVQPAAGTMAFLNNFGRVHQI